MPAIWTSRISTGRPICRCLSAIAAAASAALRSLLDPADRLAARLARDGESEPVHIEETDTTFTIAWKGHYSIDGSAFLYSDLETGRTSTILGYPTDKLTQTV
jgi:hypothetical protein